MSQEVTTYAALCEKLVKPEHDGPWGRAWQRVMGGEYDKSWARLEQARAVRWPEYTPPDALYDRHHQPPIATRSIGLLPSVARYC